MVGVRKKRKTAKQEAVEEQAEYVPKISMSLKSGIESHVYVYLCVMM
jgi:hypothetical protein